MISASEPLNASVSFMISLLLHNVIGGAYTISIPLSGVFDLASNVIIAVTADTGKLGVTGDSGTNMQANP